MACGHTIVLHEDILNIMTCLMGECVLQKDMS